MKRSRQLSVVEGLEDRTFFSVTLSKSALYFNDPVGGVKGPNVNLTIRDSGATAIKIKTAAISGTNASQFLITSKPGGGALPVTVASGGSKVMSIAFNPTAGTTTGVKTATLTLTTTDPSKPTITVPLRGLATAGQGGLLEPSLQRILDLYQIGVRTGDTNPASTYMFSTAEPRGANDEVTAQLLKKAGTGSVTIQPLAAFAGGSPAGTVGWYKSGSPAAKNKLFTVAGTTSQSVNPTLSGATSFDPGSISFGLYSFYTNLGTTQYSQDSLNTAEKSIKRKIRFFPLKQNGKVVANAYVFTTEDWNNDNKGGTDSNDFVGIIRNVKIAG